MPSTENVYRQGLKAIEGEDYAKALRLLRQAAEAGHAQAQYRLGIMHANAEGVQLDYTNAANWLRRAADQDLGHAQSLLGWLYAMGYGVEQDDGQAGHWYLKAAEQGFAKDQYTVAAMYRWGRYGVERNLSEMIRWYERAANQGFAPAQYALGQMLARGIEVRKDAVTAFQWLSMAIVNGSESAKKALMELTDEMTAEEIQRAKQQMMAAAQDHGRTTSVPETDVGHAH